jgi:hypothetical protein
LGSIFYCVLILLTLQLACYLCASSESTVQNAQQKMSQSRDAARSTSYRQQQQQAYHRDPPQQMHAPTNSIQRFSTETITAATYLSRPPVTNRPGTATSSIGSTPRIRTELTPGADFSFGSSSKRRPRQLTPSGQSSGYRYGSSGGGGGGGYKHHGSSNSGRFSSSRQPNYVQQSMGQSRGLSRSGNSGGGW